MFRVGYVISNVDKVGQHIAQVNVKTKRVYLATFKTESDVS